MDPEAKKRALRMIPSGLYLLGVRGPEGQLNVFVASWVSQTSFKPPMVMVGVRKDSHSNLWIRETGVFALSILGTGQKPLATVFLKDTVVEGETMGGVPFVRGPVTGVPIIPETPAHLECRVRHVVDAENDHTVFVAEVVGARFDGPAEPLTSAETGWHYGG